MLSDHTIGAKIYLQFNGLPCSWNRMNFILKEDSPDDRLIVAGSFLLDTVLLTCPVLRFSKIFFDGSFNLRLLLRRQLCFLLHCALYLSSCPSRAASVKECQIGTDNHYGNKHQQKATPADERQCVMDTELFFCHHASQ